MATSWFFWDRYSLMAGLILFLSFYAFHATANEPLSLVVSDSNPILSNAENTGILDQLVLETFRRAGISITITPLPSERAITNANKGIDDGDLLRIAGLSHHYPNLIQLSEKWMDMEFSPFARRPNIHIFSWQDLAPFSIGLIKGWKVFEKTTKHVAIRSRVKDAAHLFTLLGKDRVDIILYDRLQGKVTLKKLGMQNVYEAGPPLSAESLFLYMHKKHAALIPEIEAVLRQMKQDGSHARLLSDALAAAMQ